MARDSSGSWVQKANNAQAKREQPKSAGNIILEMADRMFPRLMNFFQNKRDESGMLMQPAHVRSVALNIAQELMKNRAMRNANNNG